VPLSDWDHVYGNADGRLSLDERGIALIAEAVLAIHPMEVSLKSDIDRDPQSPFRAGASYKDDSGAVNVRIYPGAIGMTWELIPYVVAHELGHVALGHVGREPSRELELEAERWAGRALAECGEDLEVTIRALESRGRDSDSHGALAQRIAAIRAGYEEGTRTPRTTTATTPRTTTTTATTPRTTATTAGTVRTSAIEDRFHRFASALDGWISALGATRHH